MPKAILEFQLPEEQSDLRIAQEGGRLHSIIYNIEMKLRATRKHYSFEAHGDAAGEVEKFFDALDAELLEILSDMPEDLA